MSEIIIKNLKVKYGEKVIIDGLDLAFEKGKINVLLGGSGVGKTTLLSAVSGLIKSECDVCEIDKDKISFIFQKDRLIPTISVHKNLDLILKTVYADKKEREQKIDEMLNLLEISDVKNALPLKLSGGQAQRVAIARAFLYPSETLIMDEPFKALDTALKSRLISALITLNEKENRTILFVTHAVDECLLSADKWFVLGSRPATVICQGKIDVEKTDRNLADERLSAVRNELLKALYN